MSNVTMPQKKQNPISGALPTLISAAGSIVGGAFGGPAGAAVGGAVGGMAGHALGGANKPQGNMPQQSTPMQRRMQTMGPDETLQQGEAALAQLPPEYQQQYGPAIGAARQASMQRRGMA